MTLDRLEEKGYLRSWHSQPTAERGGRSRRHYELTKKGVAALGESRQALLNMWRGLEPRLGKP
jgi:PadR family transcriptional regulator